ncbi:PREDICTED: E3 ubiquitin-protein ligase TRIM11-like [Sturnus vulgaris]|uniref:E3 ubiquitin-protein ligase TRIM11-like n=1 Tax=Sturnus vulgaris TaxID=9172 RepID=UPI00071A2E0F|nr:PREDICTED: E3 ubiquitin-protein ligase TRIM11-like [Sturnus vulgaris]
MARPGPAQQLVAEASCPLCLDLFQDPVSIPCGHNFCRACIERCWATSGGSWACPSCRAVSPERSLRPSRELARVAEIARGLLRAGPGSLCGRHREPLRLFCRDERALLCPECGRCRRHRGHRLLPAPQAAREYQVRPPGTGPAAGERGRPGLEGLAGGFGADRDRSRSEGQRTAREFQELRRVLDEQERRLLEQRGDLDGALGRAQERALAKVSEELSQLDTLMWEMEGKFQQPPSRFLQEIPQLLDSCETMKFHPPAEISPELQRSLEDFAQRNALVRGALRRCQDSLMFLLQEPAELTLDPHTAHPHLHLSEDGKEARGLLVPRDVPDHPERFDFEPCVLARGGFTSGRHFWDVEVGQGGVWALGVLRESSRRRGPLSLTPKEGVWALEAFHSLTSPRASVGPQPPPRRLRVCLDYEGRRVAFFSAGGDAPILEYTRAAFNGERLRPCFKLGLGARLREVARSPRCGERAGGAQAVSPLDWVGFGFSLRICPETQKRKRQHRESPVINSGTEKRNRERRRARNSRPGMSGAPVTEPPRVSPGPSVVAPSGPRWDLEIPGGADPEPLWLPQLEDLKNELEKRQKKTPEVSQPGGPAQGQEEKSQQPDVKSSSSRCGKVTFQLPLDAAPGLEERVCHFSWRSSALKETLRKLQASVTLDPDTAHPELVLSEDGKSVWRGAGARELPASPERFDYWPFVLGQQRFAAGRHCWDVDVGDGGDWAVGVARESVPRKGRLSLGPQGGIWGLEKWGGQVRALTTRKVTLVALRWLPRRVSVHLDCGGGSVAFFDAEDGGLLFVFSRVSFAGERLRPWLWVPFPNLRRGNCPEAAVFSREKAPVATRSVGSVI